MCGDKNFFYNFDDQDNKFVEIIDYISEEEECEIIQCDIGSYLKENLIHKWVTNIVRQNDGYEFLLDDEVYLPVYKYALKITKRKTVKLNLVEEKVLQNCFYRRSPSG